MSHLMPHPEVVFTRLNREHAALLHLETRRYYTLNSTGLRIWELLCEGRQAEEIAGDIEAEFEVDTGGARAAVEDLVADLDREGLVRSGAGS